MVSIACPECGATEGLRGERHEGVIWIDCSACGHRWPRNPDVCPRCGGTTIADMREPLFQKARGTQQSIVGYRIVQECWKCGYRSAEARSA
jgi:Zn ribbon nucleic-acid-binding protein